MKKRLLRFCVLLVFLGIVLAADSKPVKADLMLDDKQIDGSYDILFNQQPLLEIQFNGMVVWRAGADITYEIDNGISETHFVPYGQDILSVVTCNKEGYEFAGWREDGTATGEILETDPCIGNDKTVYAVFRKAVTVSCHNGSREEQKSVEYIYYNNGNINHPEFTIEQKPLDGWTARGWGTSTVADAAVEYDILDCTAMDSDITLYGLYDKTITVGFEGNGADSGRVDPATGTAYYNSSGNILNPAFKLPANGYTRKGFVFAGWLQGGAGTAHGAGASVTLSSDTIFKAKWQTPVSNFGYTGGIQQYTVPFDGYYRLEVWGASGGAAHGESYTRGRVPDEDVRGGYGGYASGYKYLSSGTLLYICVGGAGGSCSVRQTGIGGFNGGSDGIQNHHTDGVSGEGHHVVGGGGGGATHVALRSGLLEQLSGHVSEILLVAGGGGGGLDDYEPDEDGNGDVICGDPGGEGGSDINPDDARWFGKSPLSGSGGGYYTSNRESGGSNYIGGVLPALTYDGHVYTSTSGTSSHDGNGAVTITYLGN